MHSGADRGQVGHALGQVDTPCPSSGDEAQAGDRDRLSLRAGVTGQRGGQDTASWHDLPGTWACGQEGGSCLHWASSLPFRRTLSPGSQPGGSTKALGDAAGSGSRSLAARTPRQLWEPPGAEPGKLLLFPRGGFPAPIRPAGEEGAEGGEEGRRGRGEEYYG